jgi:predicted O-methyltransferase YrrM
MNDGSPDRPVRYENLAGLSWLSVSELAWLVGRLPERGVFVEVGTASGVTAALIAAARPGLTVLCVDTFADMDRPWVPDRDRPALWARNRRPNMHLFVGTLADLARLAPGLDPAAVLIDGDHAEDAVRADLTTADRLLPAGGVIYCHDLDDPAPELAGVGRAVEGFCAAAGFVPAGQHWTLRALVRARG